MGTVPEVVATFSDGSAALAADFYDEQRAVAAAAGRFRSELVVLDRVVKIRRGVAWAAQPLFTGDDAAAAGRLSTVVRSEVARPYRDTIITNQHRDTESVGWKRIARPDACGFCLMAADKGAIYKESTALFAAHDDCSCTAAPVFRGQVGKEASVIQYVASKRRRTAAEKARLREWVAFYEGR